MTSSHFWGFSELLRQWATVHCPPLKLLIKKKNFFFNFLSVLLSMWDLNSPNQGSDLRPVHQKHGVLATGPRGKSRSPPFNQLSTCLVRRLQGLGIQRPASEVVLSFQPSRASEGGQADGEGAEAALLSARGAFYQESGERAQPMGTWLSLKILSIIQARKYWLHSAVEHPSRTL